MRARIRVPLLRVARRASGVVMALAAAGIVACGGDDGGASSSAGDHDGGRVRVDGAAAVYPLSRLAAEEYMRGPGKDQRVTVSFSGTSGGFQRFCSGETDMNGAARAITAAERRRCEQNGVTPLELPAARDGVAVVVNPAATFVDCLTLDELQRLWAPGSAVQTWADVRASFPKEAVQPYGPGEDSGTFAFFTAAINGEAGAIREDFVGSGDENAVVQEVSTTRGATAFIALGYYDRNRSAVKGLSVDGGSGCVAPDRQTIADGTYTPLSRPLYLYVSVQAARRPDVAAFLEYYMEEAGELAGRIGYAPLDPSQYEANVRQIQDLPGADEGAGGDRETESE